MEESKKTHVPPIKTQGIKTKLVPFIRDLAKVREDEVWVEPFMGSGVVGFNVAPRRALFSDTNVHIINFYNEIKNGQITPQLVKEFLESEGRRLSEGDAEYYYEVRNRFNREHSPMDFLFLNRSCFNGMIRFNKNYDFNVPYGHKPERFAKAYVTKIVNQVAHVKELLRWNDWQFEVKSFEEAIREAPANAFIYCDPPYLGRHVDYFDSWNEEQELLLHELLMGRASGRFMVSTWDHNKYRENEYLRTVWGDCTKTTREHFYFVGARESNRGSMVEALLTNFKPMTNERAVDSGHQYGIQGPLTGIGRRERIPVQGALKLLMQE